MAQARTISVSVCQTSDQIATEDTMMQMIMSAFAMSPSVQMGQRDALLTSIVSNNAQIKT